MTKVNIEDSDVFKGIVAEFYKDVYPDFEFIDPSQILFIASAEFKNKENTHTHYAEIYKPSFETKILFPEIKYVFLAHPPFVRLNGEKRDKILYHLFSHIPKDYKNNPRILAHDIEEFRACMTKYAERDIKELMR